VREVTRTLAVPPLRPVALQEEEGLDLRAAAPDYGPAESQEVKS
jgi:hypothetical protein